MCSRASTSRCASGSSSSKHVGIAQQARGEPDELALAAGEDASRLAEVVVVEADLREERSCASLEAGAAGGGPALDDLLLAAAADASASPCPSPARRAAPRPWRGPTRARRGPGALRAASAARRGRRPRAAAAETRARVPRRVVISPASAVSAPVRMRSSVDLPPPFGPMIPMRTPGSTSKSSPSRISREPKLFVIPRAWSRDMRPG